MPRRSRPARSPVGCVLLFVAPFVLLGAGMAIREAVRLLTWRAVPVVVRSTDVESVRGGKGTTYRPTATWAYEAGGRTIVGSGVTISRESRSHAWASDIVERFPVGARVAAYVSPRDPALGFLIRTPSFLPYVFVLLPAGMLLLLAVAHRPPAVRAGEVAPATGLAGGRWALRAIDAPAALVARRTRVARGWSLLVALAFAPYLALARPPFDPLFLGFGAATALVTVLLWRWRGRAGAAAATVADVSVVLDRERLQLGEGAEATVTMQLLPGARLASAQVGLVCEAGSGHPPQPRWERWVELDPANARAEARGDGGSDIVARVPLAAPANEIATTTALYAPEARPVRIAGGAPTVTWRVVVRWRGETGTGGRAAFPVVVVDPDVERARMAERAAR